ncbi:MAG: MotA/TolQ/ExbB proton channel family protein [Nitrospiraceae bacterium]|nr:MotA/TolQ/ExbB proton channel family protein [Nitrospiraceae bacterium]
MPEVLDMLKQGGLLMWPIAVCSLVAATIIIERFIALRRSAVIEPCLQELVDDYPGEQGADAALALCRRSRASFARIVEQVILTRHLGHAQSIEAVHAAGRTQLSALERGLTLLEIIAGISPLLGLLGTVLGMVTVFNAITAQGIGDPQVLSSGISEALATTVAGLVVAIPSLAFHSLLSRRVDDLGAEMQNAATRLAYEVRAAAQHGGR